MTQLRAGVARATITPPVGIPLVGFAGRGPSEGVEDDLFATVLALESDGERAVIVAADCLFFAEPFSTAIRMEIGRRAELPPGRALLCASHTHYGPPWESSDDSPPMVAAYLENLKHLLAGAAAEAMANAQAVRIGFASGQAFIGINRRERRPDGRIVLGNNPEGPCDREVSVVRIDRSDGGPLATLVNFPCHPVSPGGGMRMISADYVGVMRKTVEAITDAPVLFLQGAAGNINPIEMRHSFDPARRLGRMLAAEVLHQFEEISTVPAEGLAHASERIDLPAMTWKSIDEGEGAAASLRAEVESLRSTAGGALWWAESRLGRAEAMIESIRTGIPLPPIPAEIDALRFGEVALATAPGEIFTETGMEVKSRSPIPHTLFAAYSNDSVGYVPVPSAYPEGGYEVTHACRVGPAAAGMISHTALRLLGQVAP